MNQRHQDTADRLVAAFRSGLDDSAQAGIGEAGFERLHALVREALSGELKVFSGRLEGLLHELRAEIDRPDIGL